ncbi:MAG TPA: WD40 repeat domain-containing protein, partial [Anaerolineales bacterium]
WDADTGDLIYTLAGHTLPVTGVAFDPSGKYLATTSWDFSTRIWSIHPTSEALFIPIESPWSMRVSYSVDGEGILADFPDEKSVKVWDANSGNDLLKLNENGSLTSFSAAGKLIAAVSYKNIIIWDADSGKQKFSLIGHSASITCLGFSSDGTRLISSSSNGELIVWDMVNGKQALKLQEVTEGFSPFVQYEFFAAAFSPDGKHILTGNTYGEATLWDANTGKKLNTKIFEEAVGNHSFPDIGYDITFSPDSKYAAITGGIGTVRIWDVSTGDDVLTLKGHSGAVNSVTFSADGKMIATASVDGTAKIWDASTGANLLTLPVDVLGAGDVVFSPDGERLAVGGVSGIYVFALPIEDVIELAKSQLTRSLTLEECQQYLHLFTCPTDP